MTAQDTLSPDAADTSVRPVLTIENLTIDFHTEDGLVPAVGGISLEVRSGEVLALVGESGSGKSVTALAIMGLLPSTAVVQGTVSLSGEPLLSAPESRMNEIRGKDVSMVFQEPMTALNPTMTIGAQITEVLLNHKICGAQEAWDRAIALLERVGIPDAERRAKGYPHELSGGQRQRVVIAIALASHPKLIIADEPTTALDVTVQAEILDLIRELAEGIDAAFLLITHNMGVVADVAHRVAVMYRGDLVEVGDVDQVLLHPQADYSRALLDAVPKLPDAHWETIVSGETATAGSSHAATVPAASSAAVSGAGDGSASAAAGSAPAAADDVNDASTHGVPALAFSKVCVDYRRGGTVFRAVSEVDLHVDQGEIVGLVGESGSGKSTLGRAALGLLPVASGTVAVLSQAVRDKAFISRAERRVRQQVGVVFQDSGSALDPRMTIGESVAEPLRIHGMNGRRMTRGDRNKRVRELLDAVELPASYERRFPHELSGGQRQRVGLARAISLEPSLLIADEPTSALDVSVQAHVLDVLRQLQARFGFACLFISHDLAVVYSMASRVAVMLKGAIVETGTVDEVLIRPQHPYSRRLLAAAPSPNPHEQARRREARRVLADSEPAEGAAEDAAEGAAMVAKGGK